MKPEKIPMPTGTPIPTSFSRVITAVRYRATGSLGPLVGTNTGLLRYASATAPNTTEPKNRPTTRKMTSRVTSLVVNTER